MESLTMWVNLGLIVLFVAAMPFRRFRDRNFLGAAEPDQQMADMGDKAAKNRRDAAQRTGALLFGHPGRHHAGFARPRFGMKRLAPDRPRSSQSSPFGDSHAIQTAAHTASYAFAFVVISFLHVVAGELAPALAFHKAGRSAWPSAG